MKKYERAKYGAAAFAGAKGKLPNSFPREMGPSCLKYLQEVVDSGLTRDMVTRFEKAFAKELGVKHCVATPGCTPALACLAAAFGFKPGDEVIVSPITDFGMIQGLIRENLIPVFADTEPGSINISAKTIEPCITQRTRAILVVHKTGIVCDMDPINALAKKHKLIVYEDVCQAIFSEYKGRYAGTLSKAAGFSFDAEKTMGSDIGGCVVTDNAELAERVRLFGQSRGGVIKPGYGRKHIAPGYAYRMANCTAAICLAQLEIIKRQVAKRDKMARFLTSLISNIPGIIPLQIPQYQNVYSCWMFGFRIDPKMIRCSVDSFAKQLLKAGITGAGTGRYYLMPEACGFLDENARKKIYPYSMPPASRKYRYSAGTCPNARDFLKYFIRWITFSDKYTPDHCELAADIIHKTDKKNYR